MLVMLLRKLAKLAMLLRKLAMLSRVSKVIQKDNRRSEILKGLISNHKNIELKIKFLNSL
jgi:hypothetical protein